MFNGCIYIRAKITLEKNAHALNLTSKYNSYFILLHSLFGYITTELHKTHTDMQRFKKH